VPLLRVPTPCPGTVRRVGGSARGTFRVVLEGESRGALDLGCDVGERFPGDLRIGESLRLALELELSVLVVDVRVCGRTGSTLRVTLSGLPSEQPRRRRHTRVRVNQSVSARIARADGKVLTVPARIVDLSPGGCSLRLDVVVTTGTEVTFEADVPARVSLAGVVVRAGGGDAGTIGVSFVDVPAEIPGMLQQFLREAGRRRSS